MVICLIHEYRFNQLCANVTSDLDQPLTLDFRLEGFQIELVALDKALFSLSQAADLISDLLRLFVRRQFTYPVACKNCAVRDGTPGMKLVVKRRTWDQILVYRQLR